MLHACAHMPACSLVAASHASAPLSALRCDLVWIATAVRRSRLDRALPRKPKPKLSCMQACNEIWEVSKAKTTLALLLCPLALYPSSLVTCAACPLTRTYCL